MATSTAAASLSQKHQQQVNRTGLLFYALALRLWQQYAKQKDVDESAARWMAALIPKALQGRNEAARQGREYYQTFRILETPERAIWQPPTQLVSLERSVIETSLRVTGPVAFKAKAAKIADLDADPRTEKALLDRAFTEAGEQAAAAVMRHVADGAREQVVEDVKADPLALGYMRVTKSGNPCYFCAILASRGPVYEEDSFEDSDGRFTGVGTAKAHDNCSCSMEPVFSRATAMPDTSRRANEVWGNVTAGKSGSAAIIAFRRAWEGRSG